MIYPFHLQGSDHEFLDSIAPYYWYLVNIKANTQVWLRLKRPEVGVPAYKGRERKPSKKRALTSSLVVSVIANKSDLEWKKVILAEGGHGPTETEMARIRVLESRDKLPGNECCPNLKKTKLMKLSTIFVMLLKRYLLKKWSKQL